MKKLFLLLLPVLLFASCDDDGYSLGDFWIDIATVENPESSSYFDMKMDDGDLMHVAVSNFYYYRPKTGQRILANYTILNKREEGSFYDYDVKLNDAYDVLTKGIFNLTDATQDSIGNNAIGIYDMWIGSDYLNVEFYYRGYNRSHYITLAKDDAKQYNDGKVHLEFRHNTNGDNERYRYYGIASFNLSSLQTLSTNNSLDLVIHVKEFDSEEKTYNLTYNFGEKAPRGKEFNKDIFEQNKNTVEE